MKQTITHCFFFVINIKLFLEKPGCVAQLVGHLTSKSGVLGSISGLATYFRFSFCFFKKGSCQYVLEVLVNRLGGLSLPRKSVVRLTDHPDMTLGVYRGRKTTIQQQHFLEKRQGVFIIVGTFTTIYMVTLFIPLKEREFTPLK